MLVRATELSESLPPNFANRHVAWQAKGNLLAILRRNEEALSAFDKADKLNPNNINVLLGRGDVLFQLQDSKEARDTFSRAADMAKKAARRPTHFSGRAK